MIHSQDRSGWVGASDTYALLASWDSKTFASFLGEKLGLVEKRVKTQAMDAGTHWEGKILDALGIRKRDRQIKVRRLRLRVNLDGEDKTTVTEVKTHQSEEFDLCKRYWMQAQVEMYVTGKRLRVAAYRLTGDELSNYYLPLDPERVSFHDVDYDPAWIEDEYLPRLRVVASCIKERRWPNEGEVARFTRKRRKAASHGGDP